MAPRVLHCYIVLAQIVAGCTFVPSSQQSSWKWIKRTKDRPSLLPLAAAAARQSMEYPTLTVVIPAYNEEYRIEPTLRSYVSYLEQSPWSNVTILVANDGSTDGTAETVCRVAKSAARSDGTPSHCRIECYSLPYNQGKGAALAAAMERVHSTLILTADADGSASVESLDVLYDALWTLLDKTHGESDIWTQPSLVCGYRTYADTALGRRLFRWGFRATVATICGPLGVRDSQCGCKLFTVTAAQTLFRKLHLTGWSHDVEVLYRAKLLHLPMTEAPVQWNDKDGSKLTAEGVIKVAMRMFYDVIQCRLMYDMGRWTI